MCEADDSLIFLRIFQKLVECTAESIYGAMPVYEKECKSMAKVTRKDFRELQESFLKEKKELHAKFVAERSAIYGM